MLDLNAMFINDITSKYFPIALQGKLECNFTC